MEIQVAYLIVLLHLVPRVNIVILPVQVENSGLKQTVLVKQTAIAPIFKSQKACSLIADFLVHLQSICIQMVHVFHVPLHFGTQRMVTSIVASIAKTGVIYSGTKHVDHHVQALF